MNPRLQCAIELLEDPSEEAWILSVRYDDVPTGILLINGLMFRKIPRITFVDEQNKRTAFLCADQHENYALHLMDRPVPVTRVWLEALLSVFLDAQFHGWHEGIHLDAEFPLSGGTVEVTVCVSCFQ